MYRLQNKKGAGTLVIFTVLLPVIVLLGCISVDIAMFAVIKSHLQNYLDTSVISAVNLSIRDEFRSDRKLIIFRVPEMFPDPSLYGDFFGEDFRAFVDNFDKSFREENMSGSLEKEEPEPDIDTEAKTCIWKYQPIENSTLPITSTTVTIEVETSPDFDGNWSENIKVYCDTKIALPLLTNAAGLFGYNNNIFVPVRILTTVGNVRIETH